MTENTLFQEIQEDLERQKLAALWGKYGFWIIVAALGIVVATASSTAYHSWKAKHDQSLTAGLVEAAKVEEDVGKSLDQLQKYAADHGDSGLAALALLRAGALALDKNDKAKAIELFDKTAADAKADPAFRQLGDLLSVQAQLDSGDPVALSQRLQPLTDEHATWRFSALEAQGYLALRRGDKAKAKQIFTDLSQDARAPKSMNARAVDVLRSLAQEAQ